MSLLLSDARSVPFVPPCLSLNPGNVGLISFLPALSQFRGGASPTEENAVETAVVGRAPSSAVGILDLRPNATQPSNVFPEGEGDDIGTKEAAPFDVIIVSSNSLFGIFPVGSDDPDEENAPRETFDQQSAAAETIGVSCNDVVLLLSYDPAGGKTVLHRHAGVKLAAVVNGIRRRQTFWKRDSGRRTKLTLLLFRSGTEDGDIVHDDGEHLWDDTGANFLVERLRTFFAMGGGGMEGGASSDSVQDPFESVDIVPITSSTEKEADSVVRSVISRLAAASAISEAGRGETPGNGSGGGFRSLLQSTYESMGGVGKITYKGFNSV
eukprot:CAMPEP_0172488840 /NCGR_PEP_ID=MMETSP1066-20121228/18554_1 /TAXON_ID=671091 /ORGANISM="Coscinodiscus wailesii, Strain CCMP2513" /LENGTH=323 /DNA_ID=CAMNT_0013256313 /DNA_START=56 /DNA_END=1027 /DNA_ORIENTATION=-